MTHLGSLHFGYSALVRCGNVAPLALILLKITIEFVTVVSVLEVHSRHVQSRDSIRWRLQRFLTIRRPTTALDADYVCDVHRPAMYVAVQPVASLCTSGRTTGIAMYSGDSVITHRSSGFPNSCKCRPVLCHHAARDSHSSFLVSALRNGSIVCRVELVCLAFSSAEVCHVVQDTCFASHCELDFSIVSRIHRH